MVNMKVIEEQDKEIKKLKEINADLLAALKDYVDEDGGSFDAPHRIGEKALKAIARAGGKE